MLKACLSILIASCCLVSTAMSQETPLEFFPESVAVVVRWHAPAKSQDRLIEMVESIDVGWGVLVENALKNVGTALENDSLGGVDDTKDWWVGFDIENYAIIYAIPGTDLEAMSLSLNEERAFVAKGEWGVYSEDASVIEQIKNPVAGKTMSKLIPEDLKKTPEQPSIEVIISTGMLLKKYPDFLEEFNKEMDEAIEEENQADEEVVDPSPSERAAMLGRKLGQSVVQDAIKQAMRESEFVKIQLSLNKDSIEMRHRFAFQKDSAFQKALLIPGRDCVGLIQQLPLSDLYLATSVDSINWGFEMIDQLMHDPAFQELDKESPPQEMERLQQAKENWKSSGFRGVAAGFSTAADSEEGILKIATVVDAESTKHLSKLASDLTEAIQKNEHTELSTQPAEIQGTTVTQIKIPSEQADDDDFELQIKNMLLGSGTTFAHYGMNDTKAFATFGNSSKFTEAVIKTSLKGEADVTAPKLAPAKSGQTIFLMAIDPVSFLQNFMTSADHGLRNMKSAEPYPNANVNFTWTKQPLPKSYVVTEFSTSPSSADLTITVPVTTVKNVKAILPQLVPLVMRQGHLSN